MQGWSSTFQSKGVGTPAEVVGVLDDVEARDGERGELGIELDLRVVERRTHGEGGVSWCGGGGSSVRSWLLGSVAAGQVRQGCGGEGAPEGWAAVGRTMWTQYSSFVMSEEASSIRSKAITCEHDSSHLACIVFTCDGDEGQAPSSSAGPACGDEPPRGGGAALGGAQASPAPSVSPGKAVLSTGQRPFWTSRVTCVTPSQ